MKPELVVYWSRRDFRLRDNPALTTALKESEARGVPFLPIFVLEDYMTEGNPESQFGYPQRYFLSKSLPVFAEKFTMFFVVRGKAAHYFQDLSNHLRLTIFVNDDVYHDFYTQIEKLKAAGVSIEVLSDALTISKNVRTGQGNIYSIFTPFKKSVWNEFVSTREISSATPGKANYPLANIFNLIPDRIEANEAALTSYFSKTRTLKIGETIIDLEKFQKLPELDCWYTSENEAIIRFKTFLHAGFLDAYKNNRDSLEKDTEFVEVGKKVLEGKTSKMSLALAWGLVSPRTLVKMIKDHFDEPFDNPFSNRVSEGALVYISELIWREFYRYLLFHKPELMYTEFQEKFRGTIQWVKQDDAMKRFLAWIKGETGYQVVDAAMHQIAHIGWMHNRSRMIVASILTKNLGVDWRWGQEYFRSVLIDLDEASNNGGWQWGASVGADPKPIRIFNPELQAKNHDASGAYRDKWLFSEISFMRQSPSTPLVEHATAREEALRRYGLTKIIPRDY